MQIRRSASPLFNPQKPCCIFLAKCRSFATATNALEIHQNIRVLIIWWQAFPSWPTQKVTDTDVCAIPVLKFRLHEHAFQWGNLMLLDPLLTVLSISLYRFLPRLDRRVGIFRVRRESEVEVEVLPKKNIGTLHGLARRVCWRRQCWRDNIYRQAAWPVCIRATLLRQLSLELKILRHCCKWMNVDETMFYIHPRTCHSPNSRRKNERETFSRPRARSGFRIRFQSSNRLEHRWPSQLHPCLARGHWLIGHRRLCIRGLISN